jgi:hypothetical protein
MDKIEWIERLKKAVMGDNPPEYLILAAAWVATESHNSSWYYTEGPIPTWVWALANGNVDQLEDLIKHVRSMIEAEK